MSILTCELQSMNNPIKANQHFIIQSDISAKISDRIRKNWRFHSYLKRTAELNLLAGT